MPRPSEPPPHPSGPTDLVVLAVRDVTVAAAEFRRMLWLNPSDNQGVRFELPWVEDGKRWEEVEAAGGG